MAEDPEIIRLHIQHYRTLLGLQSTTATRQQILNLLAAAQAQSPLAEAEARAGRDDDPERR